MTERFSFHSTYLHRLVLTNDTLWKIILLLGGGTNGYLVHAAMWNWPETQTFALIALVLTLPATFATLLVACLRQMRHHPCGMPPVRQKTFLLNVGVALVLACLLQIHPMRDAFSLAGMSLLGLMVSLILKDIALTLIYATREARP